MSALTTQLKALREQVSALHAELVRYGLVVWTAGNVSGRVPGHDLMVIKPSGVSYDELTPESMIVCDLDGNVVEGDLSPSSDTAAHAYVYRHMPEVGGVVHTHSTYACAWAARGEPVPCVLTAMADEFGGEIPVGPFALIGDDSIGRGIVETLSGHRSAAVLMRSHGVFTIGKDARAAVKAAVMCEDVARSVHLARQLGEPLPHRPGRHRPPLRPLPERLRPARKALSPSPSHPIRTQIFTLTPNGVPRIMSTSPTREIWFVTGSQGLYGEETLRQVASQSQVIAEALDAAPDIVIRVVWKPVLTDAAAIRRLCLDATADDSCIGLIAWMHTFSPAKMWIAGLEALRKPLLHLHTQANVALPWADIDMDFMNLNQAAHGDREFGYIQTRLGVARKTVAGHVSDPRVIASVATWARAAAGWAATRSLKLARFGDNMRYVAVTEGDKTEAEAVFGVQVNTWGVNDLVAAVDAAPKDGIDELVAEYADRYDVAPELLPGGERHESLRYGAAIELGLRSFLDAGGFGAFTTSFEDLGGLRQLPGLAVQRLMADGYGFGAEGDWKTAILVRAAKVMGAGLPGGASLMEDYTYDLTPGEERILGAHMLEVCPTLTAARPRLEIHPLSIGGREDPVRLVFTADPGPGVVVALSDMRDRFRLVANQVELVPPTAPLPKLPVGRAVWKPAPDFATSATAWLTAGAAHHTAMSTAVGLEAFEDYARMAGTELLVIDSTTTLRSFEAEIRANAAYYRLARGI